MLRKASFTAIIAILAITAIEVVALCNGINGQSMSIALSGIAGLGGFALGRVYLVNSRLNTIARPKQNRARRKKKR